MGDRNRLSTRIFQKSPRYLDNDDDNLAPVVLAIDAVQLLMDQEDRVNKLARSKSTKKNELERSQSPVEQSSQLQNETIAHEQVSSKSRSASPKPSTSSAISFVTQPGTLSNPLDVVEAKLSVARAESIEDTKMKTTTPPKPKVQDCYLVRNELPAPRIIDPARQNQLEEYEFIPKSVILDVYSNDPEVKRFLKQLPKIGIEFGLNEQDYKCYSCRRPVGMVFGQPKLCYFDGHHYCSECHLGDKSVIPARIMCNWDFNKYPISKRNQHFLALISNEPMFELRVLAPLLYENCPDLVEIEELRHQAFFIRSYCFTCAQDSISLDITKLVWPREHLIKQTDSYSLEDLMQIKNGSLKQVLKNVITFGRQHVLTCVLCCQKGFICELCKSSQIIYPFDIESVHRCNTCQSIYHKACFKSKPSSESCPRCQRMRARKNKA